MRIVTDGHVQWQFLTTLYPLIKKALPSIDRLPDEKRRDLRIQNAVTTIRHSILSIPLRLQQVQLNHDLPSADYDNFMLALHGLLSLFERHVHSDVHSHAEQSDINLSSQDLQLRDQYPKLSTLSCLLVAEAAPDPSAAWPSAAEYSIDILLELAKFINLNNLPTQLEYQHVSREIQLFHSTVQEVFVGTLDTSDGDLGNYVLLRDDEIEFVRRAHNLNSLSNSLFTLIGEIIACSQSHAARLDLSGFMDPDCTFDLLIAACEKQSWSCAKCRWVLNRPQRLRGAHKRFCFGPDRHAQASNIVHLAFDKGEIWDDTDNESVSGIVSVPEALPTLGKLIFPRPDMLSESDSDGGYDFEPEDQKIVELLLASSVLHLNTTRWLNGGLKMDEVMVVPDPSADNLLKRWRPYVACSLNPTTDLQDEDDDILSLGILILEMEAKRKAKPVEIDWITNQPCKDGMLKRALVDWKRRLEDGYQQIGNACLHFRELTQKFYHPALPSNMKRTAAIYKYILAPLHQLISERYCSTSLLFRSFPRPSKGLSGPMSSVPRIDFRSKLTLFDDSGSDAKWHDPNKVQYASEFLRNIQPFLNKISYLSDSNPVPIQPWRAEKVRIAIIDTGIDTDDDIMIETALEDGSIKSCRGFAGDDKDFKDANGHGTHVARLLLRLAPAAELYIAKVSNNRTIDASELTRIAEAIKWANETMKVDIISMSFGLEADNRNTDIDKAITHAVRRGVTIFAAAANNGGNKPRAYPAKRKDILCIHASDGRGNDGGISPSPERKKNNFSTLGISIESRWKKKTVLKSGTSFATPIAVALVADMLEFSRYKCSLDEYEKARLYSYDGAEEILTMMSSERQDYDYVMPLHLWDGNAEEDIARELTKIARS